MESAGVISDTSSGDFKIVAGVSFGCHLCFLCERWLETLVYRIRSLVEFVRAETTLSGTQNVITTAAQIAIQIGIWVMSSFLLYLS
jgi:hypothetical protein